MKRLSRREATLVLGLVLLAGLGLRLWGIGHGLPHPTTRPDEERIVGRALHIVGTGDFNPMSFTYPTAMIYLEALGLWLYASLGRLLGWYAETGDFMMDVAVYRPGLEYRIARSTSALLGCATIWLCYRLARDCLLSRWSSLLAATIVATNYLHVRDSHFGTVDIGATCFITASLWFAVRASRHQRARDFAIAAVFGGLATAAKYNAALVCLSMLVAACVGYLHGRRNLARSTTLVAALAALMVSSFAVVSPYNLMYPRATLDAAALVNKMLYGAETPRAFWTHVSATFPIAYGWAVYALAAAGFALALARRRPWELVLLAFALPTLWTSLTVRWNLPRYLIFIAPLMALSAAHAASTLSDRLPLQWARRRVQLPAGVLVVALLCGPGLVRAIRFDRIATRKDTRVLAAEWADQHLPARSAVVLCRGYGAPVLNTDRRRARPFESRIVACAGEGAADTDARYLITHEHPMIERYSKPSEALMERLRSEATQLILFQPFRRPFHRDFVAANSHYYDHDAFYLPFDGLVHVERSGPIIRIWKLR